MIKNKTALLFSSFNSLFSHIGWFCQDPVAWVSSDPDLWIFSVPESCRGITLVSSVCLSSSALTAELLDIFNTSALIPDRGLINGAGELSQGKIRAYPCCAWAHCALIGEFTVDGPKMMFFLGKNTSPEDNTQEGMSMFRHFLSGYTFTADPGNE